MIIHFNWVSFQVTHICDLTTLLVTDKILWMIWFFVT
jgi:hypothetical protein